jgi:hypothetical protein
VLDIRDIEEGQNSSRNPQASQNLIHHFSGIFQVQHRGRQRSHQSSWREKRQIDAGTIHKLTLYQLYSPTGQLPPVLTIGTLYVCFFSDNIGFFDYNTDLLCFGIEICLQPEVKG